MAFNLLYFCTVTMVTLQKFVIKLFRSASMWYCEWCKYSISWERIFIGSCCSFFCWIKYPKGLVSHRVINCTVWPYSRPNIFLNTVFQLVGPVKIAANLSEMRIFNIVLLCYSISNVLSTVPWRWTVCATRHCFYYFFSWVSVSKQLTCHLYSPNQTQL